MVKLTPLGVLLQALDPEFIAMVVQQSGKLPQLTISRATPMLDRVAAAEWEDWVRRFAHVDPRDAFPRKRRREDALSSPTRPTKTTSREQC